MMFQAYQHYFNQKDRDGGAAGIKHGPGAGAISASSVNIHHKGGNQGRRGYRPLTTAGSMNNTKEGTRHHSRSGTGHLVHGTVGHTKATSVSSSKGGNALFRQASSSRVQMGNQNSKGNSLAASNSNLFVFKNGWQSQKNEAPQGTQFKQRPQSSNNYSSAKRGGMLSGGNQANRVWKYNNNKEQVPGVSHLNSHNSFNFSGTAGPQSAMNRTHGATAQSSQKFLTQSNKKQQQYLLSQRQSETNHQPRLIDKSLKTVLSGKNVNAKYTNQSDYVQEHNKTENSVEFNNSKKAMGLASSTGHPAWVKTHNNKMAANGRPLSSSKNSRLLNRATSASVRQPHQRQNPHAAYEITGNNLQVRKQASNKEVQNDTKEKQLQNFFKGASKAELTNDGTNRTAGTADTIHKTYESANNSKSNHANRPPRGGSAAQKARPQTSGPTTLQFYRNVQGKPESSNSIKSGIVSLSVDRNSMKYGRQSTGSKSMTRSTQQQAIQGGILDNYQIGKPIGQGAYAIVYVCYHKISMRKFAIKIYQKVKLNDSMKRKAVQREIMALKKIDHPHIIKMHDLIETSKQICIVTDYIQGISLHQYVKQQCTNRQVKENVCRKFFKQISEAFDYLHSRGIAHRDVKLDNILIEEKTNMIKVIDFGFAAFCSSSQKLKIFCGTPSYMAPELVRKHEYDGRQVDMWALGVLLFAMLAGQFPFKGQSESELYGRIQRAQVKFPETMPRDARGIILKLIEPDTRKRYRASELMREPWIKCNDLPLSVFETAGSLFRTTSMDSRAAQSLSFSGNAGSASRKDSKADGFNRNIAKFHVNAIDHLKSLGFSNRAIEDSLKTENTGNRIQNNQIYQTYKEKIDENLQQAISDAQSV